MEKLKSNGDTLDRLSELPDSLLLEILSFLNMRDVVKTTLLSKRWKYLWITSPCLDFDYCGSDLVGLRNFVNRALMLWRGTHLRKFTISDDEYYDGLTNDTGLWVLFAQERKVEELFLITFFPPQCLYECSSIRKLTLCGCNLRIPGNVQWNRLNSLKLSDCDFSEEWINQVFSSSPQLETFKSYCNEGFENLSIRSSSLKKLSISSTDNNENFVLTIWAPSLEALKFSGEPFEKYLLTDVSSLTKVYIGLQSHEGAAIVEEASSQILPAIQHVATVIIS